LLNDLIGQIGRLSSNLVAQRIILASILIIPATRAASQATLSTAVGVAVDSMRGGYLRDARVVVSGDNRSGLTDSLGRFRIDSVTPGTHSLRLTHALLDTLSISVVSPATEFKAGESTSFVLAVPSGSTIAHHKCSESDLKQGTSALAGSVVDADSGDPSSGAEVVVAWTDIQVNGKTLNKTAQRRTGKVRADGSYLVCGIPGDLITGVVARRGDDSTASISTAFDTGLARQSFSMPSLRADSSVASIRPAGQLAVLKGVVVGPDGKSISGARISIDDDAVATTSDQQGSFILTGARSGTRGLTARKIGFEPVEMPVELSSASPPLTVRFRNTVKVLEAIRISAIRDIGLKRVGFLDRQKLASGRFYTPKEIESRDPLKLDYLLETAPMLRSRVSSDGHHYVTGRLNGCIRYFIDGHLQIDASPTDFDVLPDSYLSAAELGAVEVYDALSTPPEFMAAHRGLPCTTVVIWTKWKLGT
jgi:carboxypeptidase family protein